jgi:phosphate transport system protein
LKNKKDRKLTHATLESNFGEAKNGVTGANCLTTMTFDFDDFKIQGGAVERRFEIELKELKGRILQMAGYVEQAIDRAIQALTERNPSRLNEVHELESKVNQSHIDVDSACLGILARLAPVAADLRVILAIIKINTDLERMGDQAVNLSHNTEHYLKHKALESAQTLPQMSGLVRAMVREALDAFVNADQKLARKVLSSDDAVDELKNRMVKVNTELMKREPESIEAALNLILIARNLERMADHATNIAEDVIFASTGEDVRHGAGKAADKATGSKEG